MLVRKEEGDALSLSGGIRWALEFLYGLTRNYGVAIILLTILIRLVLYPFTWKQTKAMEEMKALQPKVKELEAKYKGKPEEYQKRLMELYREHKVNPLGGCLPLLLQLPFIYALFNVLRTFQFTAEKFLWLGNLSKPDPYYILPILAGVTTYIQSKQVQTDASQNVMNLIMPVFMTWISISFPAGIALYFVVTNLFSIGQQYLISRQLARQAPAEVQPVGPGSGADVAIATTGGAIGGALTKKSESVKNPGRENQRKGKAKGEAKKHERRRTNR